MYVYKHVYEREWEHETVAHLYYNYNSLETK